jgi:ABC-type dipeptide/oligopeptide/nickel transport system ATPase component
VDFNTKILDIDNFDLSYRKENAVIFILKDIRLSLFLGKFTVLIGRSGCGKTQLAQSIVSLNSQFYKSGSILVNNNNQFENILLYTNEEILQHRKKKVAFIFQDAKQALNPSIKCYDQLVEYIAFVKSYSFQEAKKYAIDLLQKVNLDYNHEVEGKYVHQMSGGQLQRLCIAMAFANDADIIIADEITSALDKDNAAIIYSLIGNHCKKNNKSCLFITHDIEDVQQLADDVHVKNLLITHRKKKVNYL